ncbi:MAG: hypothetical protein IJR77_00245 [Bacteroidales bacterium]|nr:hypothetical protein [Bacteroidales bacterium]
MHFHPSNQSLLHDIGLSVYWGECNVGATKPEETGDLYAWGEIETKDKMSWDNYKWSEGDYNKLTKYNYNEDFGRVDNNAQLEIADDIAYIKSSGQMRMPTERELNELLQTRENSNYQWEHKSLNGKPGLQITYKVNGKSIFLPYGGFRTFTNPYLFYYEQRGFYWSSTLSTVAPDGAYSLCLESDVVLRAANRFVGNSVRPVRSK